MLRHQLALAASISLFSSTLLLPTASHLHSQCRGRWWAVDVCSVQCVLHLQHARRLAEAFLSIPFHRPVSVNGSKIVVCGCECDGVGLANTTDGNINMHQHQEVCTFSTTCFASGVWQVPTVKLPHMPPGLPKLAKTTSWIVFSAGHDNVPRVLWSSAMSLILSPSVSHVLICAGLCSESTKQMSSLVTVWTRMPSGLPNSSSNTTKRLSLDFKKGRGTWYLKGG